MEPLPDIYLSLTDGMEFFIVKNRGAQLLRHEIRAAAARPYLYPTSNSCAVGCIRSIIAASSAMGDGNINDGFSRFRLNVHNVHLSSCSSPSAHSVQSKKGVLEKILAIMDEYKYRHYTQSALSKNRKPQALALPTSIALHQRGILNEKMLPRFSLSDSDTKRLLIETALNRLPQCEFLPKTSFDPYTRPIHLYKLSQSGNKFTAEEASISSGDVSLSLAIIVPRQLPDSLPTISHRHRELGHIECSISYLGTEELSTQQWTYLKDFQCALFHTRWLDETKAKYVTFNEYCLAEHPNPYLVGCLDQDEKLYWSRIEKVLEEFSRSTDSRKRSVQEYDDTMASPRVCYPTYDPKSAFIVFEPSGTTCEEDFVSSSYESFTKYYTERYKNCKVDPNGQMLNVRRLWSFPMSAVSSEVKDLRQSCRINIPQEICIENKVADPMLLLHAIALPQILYNLEHYLTTTSFVEHVLHNYPILGNRLANLPVESVREALTAKCCQQEVSYERLEWLGDAVLKLVQSDALIKWRRTSSLDEGNLDLLRKYMESNRQFGELSKITGISKFVLCTPLSLLDWEPCGLHYTYTKPVENKKPSFKKPNPPDVEKLSADVIESLLGLVYLCFGMEDATNVACELGISFECGNEDNVPDMSDDHQKITLDKMRYMLGNLNANDKISDEELSILFDEIGADSNDGDRVITIDTLLKVWDEGCQGLRKV